MIIEKNGWPYPTLMAHIKENLYEAQGQKEIKTSNFQLKLLLLMQPFNGHSEEIIFV